MKIRTTVNLREDDALVLQRAAAEAGVTRSRLVSALLRRRAELEKRRVKAWERVRYQERDESANWKKVHVSLRGDEYEFFIDLRKVKKFSVSFLISQAIRELLDDVLKMIVGKVDKYYYNGYAFMGMVVGNVTCWLFCWGIPIRMPKTTDLHP